MCSWDIEKLNIPIRAVIFSVFIAYCLLLAGMSPLGAQMRTDRNSSTTPQLHYDFPFQTMWDDAVLTSVHSGKPTLAFDLDLVDSNSIHLAEEVISSKSLQIFIRAHFEPAMNDFATDPPPAVGMDSLRNLGWRLSGLEKDYIIAVRPAIIVIGPDKAEMDRIVYPQQMTPPELEKRLTDILEGRNTMKSTMAAFWRDTTSIVMREKLIDMFEERSKYDSVLYHLEGLSHSRDFPDIARAAELRYAYLRLQIESNTAPIEKFMLSLGTGEQDSLLHYDLLSRLLDHFERKKMHDSATVLYERIMAFTNSRDPDLLNDYAWNLASYSKDYDRALALINEAISKKKDDPNFYDTRALVNGRLKRWDDAIHDEEAAVSFATKDDQTYFTQQLKYYHTLKIDAEKAALEKAAHPEGSDVTSTKDSGKK
jgi:tetratricopeptide (TPR) repeat protein